jgi:hypothetical protein
MKVKTFTGIRKATVDKQVNDWLAKSNITVRKTNVAFKGLRERGADAIAGRTGTRDLNLDLVRRETYSAVAD